jgi:hypothetical protein
MKKIFLLEIPDHLERNGEVRPSQAHVYRCHMDGLLPKPVSYHGQRPLFDDAEVLEAWRAMVKRKTQAAIARAEQSRRNRRERMQRLATA